MGHYTGVASRTLAYKTTCFLCTMAESMHNAPTKKRNDNLIEDPMGICS